MLEGMLISNGIPPRRKTIANIWNCLHLRDGNMYACGLPQKVGNNSGNLTWAAFQLTDIDVLDMAVACGSTLKLDTGYRLYGSGDNSLGCLATGDLTSRLTQWALISQSSLDGKVVKLNNCGSTQSTFGVLTDKGSLYMAGRRNAMGVGDSSEVGQTTWLKSRNNVKAWATNDSKFSIVAQTNGFAYATGISVSGSSGMFGNGRTSGTNASYEGTPTTGNTTALDFVDVECVSGTSIGITASGDLYISGSGWKLVDGVPTYTGVAGDHIFTFAKLASNVAFYSFGGSGGGGTWYGVGLAWTDTSGVTRYIGTNYNGVAGTGQTYAQAALYTTPVVVSYKLIGNSTWSWGGAYNSTNYQYAYYDTSAGLGFTGVQGTHSNTTGTMEIMAIPVPR